MKLKCYKFEYIQSYRTWKKIISIRYKNSSPIRTEICDSYPVFFRFPIERPACVFTVTDVGVIVGFDISMELAIKPSRVC